MNALRRVESRLSAWWSAWKYVAILAALVVASVALNLRQWADHRAYKRVQAKTLEAAAYKTALAVTARLALLKAKDDPKLQASVDRIEARVTKLANQKRPAPLPAQCAPGQQRMDAVNAGADR